MRNFVQKALTVSCSLLIMFAVVMITGCDNQNSSDNDTTSIEQVERETRDLLQTIASYSADKKGQAVAKADQALDSLDQPIADLQAKIDNNWDDMTASARQQARQSMQSLQQQREQLAHWREKMQSGTAESWEHVKQGFSDAYQALARASRKAEQALAEK